MDSRFVKTRKAAADGSVSEKIKCQWVIKGFQDSDVDALERRSPTLTADGLAVVLQAISSKRWIQNIADVEGAFLQGNRYERERGKLYAKLPLDKGDLIEITKCVYGLMDAPLQWWKCFTSFLVGLGIRNETK